MYHQLAKYYDRIYARKDYAAEARRLSKIARRRITGRRGCLLEVACGTGRHLAAFRRYFEVAGVDGSPEMLAVARRRLGRSVPLIRGDMRTFRLPRRFDVVVCLFSAIGYMTTRGDRDKALANFYRHLAPGGVALVEGWVLPERWRKRNMHLDVYDGSDVKIARVSRSSRRGNLSEIEMQYLIAEPGKPLRHVIERHRQPLVSAPDMLRSFRKAGFRSSAILSGPYTDRGLYIGVRPLNSR